jgi:hypothetical protein
MGFLPAAVPAATLMVAAVSLSEARANNEYGVGYDTPSEPGMEPTGWNTVQGSNKKQCYVVKGKASNGQPYTYGPYKCIEEARPVKEWCLRRGLTGVNIVDRVVG